MVELEQEGGRLAQEVHEGLLDAAEVRRDDHAGAVVGLADSAAGYGCILNLPEGATGFTTVELKINFLRSAWEGTIECEARRVPDGRTTQVWDADVAPNLDPDAGTAGRYASAAGGMV